MNIESASCAHCGAPLHSDDPQPGDWCLDCNFAFTPAENDFANKGKRIRAAAAQGNVSDAELCSLCLGTGKVFHENPPRKDTPWSKCHCSSASAGVGMNNALARKWLDKADEIDRHIAEYSPEEKWLPEVGMMEAQAETLRECASELYASIPAPVVEEIKF